MNKYIRLIFAALFVVSFASCLKDDNFDNNITGHNLSGANKIIEIGFINDPNHTSAVALDFKDEAVNPTLFFVRLAGNEAAKEDITVTLDTTGAAARVAAVGRVLMPNSFYTIPSFKVTIPKGSREVAFKIATNSFLFDPSTTYGLFYRVVSVDPPGYTVSGNYGEYITTFSAKNQWDGIYSVVSGFVQRYTAPGAPTVGDALNGPLTPANPNVTMVTVGGNTVEVKNLTWATGGGIAGIDNLRATINPDNTVTMFALGNATLVNWPGKENRYDPATKTFYLNFHWNPTANKREYSVVLKYKGPR